RAPTVFSYARRLLQPPRRARGAPSSAWHHSATAAGNPPRGSPRCCAMRFARNKADGSSKGRVIISPGDPGEVLPSGKVPASSARPFTSNYFEVSNSKDLRIQTSSTAFIEAYKTFPLVTNLSEYTLGDM